MRVRGQVEVMGKVVPQALGGVLADAWGYPAPFLLAPLLSAACLPLLFPLRLSHVLPNTGTAVVGLAGCDDHSGAKAK